MDWSSFWINIYAGFIYFILGIFISIWLIPHFTIRLIQRKNHRFLRSKIAYAISSLCDFFNQMPPEYRVNSEECIIDVRNLKFPDINDFVASLQPNLFKPTAPEHLYLKILKSAAEYEPIDRYELIQSELIRIKKLREDLQEITGLHSNTLQDEIINEISQLCLQIRMVEKTSKSNDTFEQLTGEKEGIHGLGDLKLVYEMALELLKKLVSQKSFTYSVTN